MQELFKKKADIQKRGLDGLNAYERALINRAPPVVMNTFYYFVFLKFKMFSKERWDFLREFFYSVSLFILQRENAGELMLMLRDLAYARGDNDLLSIMCIQLLRAAIECHKTEWFPFIINGDRSYAESWVESFYRKYFCRRLAPLEHRLWFTIPDEDKENIVIRVSLVLDDDEFLYFIDQVQKKHQDLYHGLFDRFIRFSFMSKFKSDPEGGAQLFYLRSLWEAGDIPFALMIKLMVFVMARDTVVW